MSGTSVSGITISGLMSGIDSSSIITQLMNLESVPLNNMKTQQSGIQSQENAIGDLTTQMTTLQSAVDALRNASALRAATASSSDTDVLTATAGAGAGEGSHTITVNQLATAEHMIQNQGLDSLTATVGAGNSTATNSSGVDDADATWFTTGSNGATYTFDFGSETALTAVTFSANTTYSMNQVAAAINARSQAVAGYNAATVVNNNGQYELQMTSKNAGPLGAMTQTLTSGDSVSQLEGWTATDGQAGAFSYTYNGTTRTLQTASGTTLQDLVDLINNDSGNPGVSASVLYSGTAYYVSLSGKSTGTNNTISINDSQTTLKGFKTADMTVTQAAQNAQVQLDNWPAEGDGWIERSSNTISDLVTGLTFNLQGAGTTTVSMTRDTTGVVNDLNTFVADYNSVVSDITNYTGYDTTNQKGGILQGDPVSTMLSDITDSLVTAPKGFVDGKDTFTLAAQLGFAFDKTGVLSLDSTMLTDALNQDYDGALALIGAQGTGDSDNSYITFVGADTTTAAGTYNLEVDYDASGNISTARIQAPGDQTWQYFDVTGNNLLMTSGSLSGLSLTAAPDGTAGAHTQTATVRVRQGFAGEVYDQATSILDSTTGLLATEKAEFQTQYDNYTQRITDEQTRLDSVQADLQAKYARLEATLAQINSQNSAYQSLLEQYGYTSNSSSSSSSSSSS